MPITLNPFKLLDPPAKTEAVETPFTGFQRDPFDAVPILNEYAEIKEDSRGCHQVRLRLKPKPGMATFMANRLGFHRDVRVDLDPQGTFFWSQIDGKQDLRSIEKKIRKQFALEPDESKKATLLFTKMLMLRHLIQLDIGEEQPAEEQPAMEAPEHV